MTIRHTGEEINLLIPQLLLQKKNQLFGLFIADVSGGVILNFTISDANQVASHGHFAILNRHTHTGRFQRSAPLEYLWHIVTQYAQVSYLASRSKTFGNCIEHSATTHGRHLINARFIGCLQAGFIVERRDRLISHSVAKNYYIFHA